MRTGSLVFVLALTAMLAACGGQTPPPLPSSTPRPSATPATASDEPTDDPSAEPTEVADATDTPEPTAEPTPKPIPVCKVAKLAAKVTHWDGAAGHQIATVTLKNTGSATCTVRGTPEVELVDAHGAILIDSQTAGASGLPHIKAGAPSFHLAHNGYVTTSVQVANYCGAAPTLPTTIAFVLPATAGRIVAAAGPAGATPPCNGAGSLGSIGMNGWRK